MDELLAEHQAADPNVLAEVTNDYDNRLADVAHPYRDNGPNFLRSYIDDSAIATGHGIHARGDPTYVNGYPVPIEAPARTAVRPAIPQVDTSLDETVTVTEFVMPTVVRADPEEVVIRYDRSEFESQVLAIVVAWCDRLHLTPPSTDGEAVAQIRRWSEEGLSALAIAILRRQLDSPRQEVGSLTDAVVASGDRERDARAEANLEGQRVIVRILVDYLNEHSAPED